MLVLKLAKILRLLHIINLSTISGFLCKEYEPNITVLYSGAYKFVNSLGLSTFYININKFNHEIFPLVIKIGKDILNK